MISWEEEEEMGKGGKGEKGGAEGRSSAEKDACSCSAFTYVLLFSRQSSLLRCFLLPSFPALAFLLPFRRRRRVHFPEFGRDIFLTALWSGPAISVEGNSTSGKKERETKKSADVEAPSFFDLRSIEVEEKRGLESI